MNIQPADLRVDTFRKPGTGSWVVTPESCVRVTHVPTGLTAECCEHRSAHANRHHAMEALAAKVAKLPKPRIYWTYYPKSRRGYWRVSPMPKPYHVNRAAWDAAHSYVNKLNEGVSNMITVTSETIRRLRSLRLWHWREALSRRAQAQAAEQRAEAVADARYAAQMRHVAALRNSEADSHIHAVQTLNDFFPAGETAEQDDAAERAAASAHDSPASDDAKPRGRDFIGMNKP